MSKVNLTFTFILVTIIAAAGTVDAKNCKKGKPCGNTCISLDKICHSGSLDRSSSGNSESTLYSSSPNLPHPSTHENLPSNSKPYNGQHSVFVEKKDGLLTIKVQNMPLREILQQIASQAEVEIVVQGGTEQTISADFSRTALEEALRRLTQDFNSVFLYGPKQMKKVLLYAKNAPSGGKAEVQQEVFAPGGAVAAASSPLPERAPVRPAEAPPSSAEENDAEAEQQSLAELMKSDDPALREEAVGMLVELEDGSSGLSQLAEMLLRDEDSGIRQLIAEALGSAGDRKALPALGKALEDKDAEVRSMAVYSLGQLGGEEAMALIKKAQKDKNQAVQQAAADALEMVAEE